MSMPREEIIVVGIESSEDNINNTARNVNDRLIKIENTVNNHNKNRNEEQNQEEEEDENHHRPTLYQQQHASSPGQIQASPQREENGTRSPLGKYS